MIRLSYVPTTPLQLLANTVWLRVKDSASCLLVHFSSEGRWCLLHNGVVITTPDGSYLQTAEQMLEWLDNDFEPESTALIRLEDLPPGTVFKLDNQLLMRTRMMEAFRGVIHCVNILTGAIDRVSMGTTPRVVLGTINPNIIVQGKEKWFPQDNCTGTINPEKDSDHEH